VITRLQGLNREATSADRRTSSCRRCSRSCLTDRGVARNRDKAPMSRDRRKRTGSSTGAVKARRLFAQDGTFRGIRSPSEEPEREESHGDFAGWRRDQGQGGGARSIRRGGRRSGCADASLYQWIREAGLTQLICFPQLTAVAPDDTRVPMFQQQALAALSGEEANINDRFQTRCSIWSSED
jgi:hypothetical protein